jgi:hypothetical protein
VSLSPTTPLIPAKAGTQTGARRSTTKDTKDTKGAPLARQTLSTAEPEGNRRAKRVLVSFVSFVVQDRLAAGCAPACLGPGVRRDERVSGAAP